MKAPLALLFLASALASASPSWAQPSPTATPPAASAPAGSTPGASLPAASTPAASALTASQPATGLPAASAPPSPGEIPWDRWGDFVRGPAFEVNVLWPFFPGGIVDFKLLVPVLRPERASGRGELIGGLHSDFATRVVRDDERHGKVAILGVKVGYRQFFDAGLHAEISADIGWREERQNVHDGTTLESFATRLWLLAGWQVDLTPRVYFNVRGGAGINLFRVGDKFASTEQRVVPGGDLNLGIRF